MPPIKNDDTSSLSHTKWNCQYHIVFTPKYRRKAIYAKLKSDIGKYIRRLCEYKGVEIVEAHAMPDHIHMLVKIPSKMAVSSFMEYLKGKSIKTILLEGELEENRTCKKILQVQTEGKRQVKREVPYLVGIYHNKNLKWPSGDKAHVICAVFKAHILFGDIQKDHESLELKFFSKDNLPEIAAIDHKNAINDFFNGIKNNID